MTSTPAGEHLGTREVAALLDIPHTAVKWWVLTRRLPATHRRQRWTPAEIYQWAAEMGLAARVPITYWPPATVADDAGESVTVPADYVGTVDVPGGVAQIWDSIGGRLAILWDPLEPPQVTLDQAAMQLGTHEHVAAVLRPSGDVASSGPGLTAVLPAIPHRQYQPPWSELVRVLGQPAPWWPPELRDPRLLRDWSPGNLPVAAVARPDIDTTALLNLAALYHTDHPAARVLIGLARTAWQRAADDADQITALITQRADPAQLTLAATALPIPSALTATSGLTPAQRRAGWIDVLSRTDWLASRCVRQAIRWNASTDFPFGNTELVDLDSPHAQEWAARLRSTVRTAAFELLDPDGRGGQCLTDPATDAPAIRTDEGIRAAFPRRLPTTSPLAEIILAGPVWIRTSDGTLYPAPRDSYHSLSWGHQGSGPATLAWTIDRLLDDITAPSTQRIANAPAGLYQLTRTELPAGTVLTRAQLHAARHGRGFPAPPRTPMTDAT